MANEPVAPPTWASPTDRTREPSFYCTGTNRFVFLTEAFLEILRRHFSDVDKRVVPESKYVLYTGETPCTADDPDSDSPAPSNMNIGSAWSTNADLSSIRPSITVKRGNVSNAPTGAIAGRYLNGADKNGIVHGERFATTFAGEHEITIIALSAAEAEILAWEIFLFLVQFSSVIVKDYMLEKFMVTGISAVNTSGASGSQGQEYIVKIPISWVMSSVWAIVLDAPVTKRTTRTINGP
jgi:hypothetical protein